MRLIASRDTDAIFPAQINDIKAVVRFVRAIGAEYKIDTTFIETLINQAYIKDNELSEAIS